MKLSAGCSLTAPGQILNGVPQDMAVAIRACTEDDIDALQAIASDTYDETFRSMNTAATMQKYLAEAFGRDRLLAELRNPKSKFYFLHADGALVGYLKLNEAPAQTDINDPDSVEIERIYIRKHFSGRGFGKRLMQFALDLAQKQQKRYSWLGVWEKNESAIAFYEKLGFKKAGRHPFRMGDEIQTDYIMKKTTGNQAADKACGE